ncbi:hypothetical protein [Actinoplanes sp. NPDC026623]|uniref:hypothetical protein n=1 Tax=Actinoplanes sp. NPDC026623 TaxID=3155610 RepID=UPI0033D11328
MSYDLAVWEGPLRPPSQAAADREFTYVCDRYLSSGSTAAPTARIAAYVEALLARFPDGEDGPLATSSLMAEARGPLLYFPIAWSRGEEVAQWAARLAEEHGLHCYDPQSNRLLTTLAERWRFELTSARGVPAWDPDAEQIRRVLVKLSRRNHYALLTRADGWYVQAGYGEQAGTRPGRYALERQDGAPDRHLRAEVTDIEDVVRAFVGFTKGDPTLATRFPWQPYAL